MRCAGHVALTVEMKNAYKISVGKPEGHRSLVRTRHSWEDTIYGSFNDTPTSKTV
jgi:hypothetical protein